MKLRSCQEPELFGWFLCLLQLIYGTDRERQEKRQMERQCRWIDLDHLSLRLPASLPAGLWLCGVSTPPVITLYDLLHSKCYINLVMPPPLHLPHTHPPHTHTPYHANIVILARNFLPLLAVTSDLMALWWLHSKMLHGVRSVQIAEWRGVCVCVWKCVPVSSHCRCVCWQNPGLTSFGLASINGGLCSPAEAVFFCFKSP